MRHHRLPALCAALLFCLRAAALTQQQVAERAAVLYAQRLDVLRSSYSLDADAAFVARVRRVAAGLLAQMARDYPDTANWQWESTPPPIPTRTPTAWPAARSWSAMTTSTGWN